DMDGDSELGSLTKGRRKIVFKKGESVFTEGSKPSGVFCLKRGKVKVHKTGSHKREQILRFAKEQQLLGSRAMIRNEYFTSSATAIEDSVLCFIPKQEFLSNLKKEEKLKSFVLANLSNNLKIAEDKIAQLSISSVGQRLAIIILRLIEVYGFQADGKTVAIELTREDMANLVGAANETTIRLLSKFRKEKLISLNGRQLTVLKSKRLAQLAIASG
ncbi:MAG: Crp/Fnr family transcriptional regulator, partial [Flavobacteriales bacterium]|nr:Crp/Fnr family transcriptional regulator [Flavobacteriales bacterium]